MTVSSYAAPDKNRFTTQLYTSSLLSPHLLAGRWLCYALFRALSTWIVIIDEILYSRLDSNILRYINHNRDFWATVCKTVRPTLSDRCLSCLSALSVTLVYCGQTVG